MSRLTWKKAEGFYISNAPCTDDLKYKLGKLEDLMEKYDIENIEELEQRIAELESRLSLNET